MKKILLSWTLILSSFIFAQKMEIVSGNFDFLKGQTQLNAQLEFNNVQFQAEEYSEEQYLDERKNDVLKNPKKSEADWQNWLSEWNRYKEEVYLDRFLQGFNKKSKIKAEKNADTPYTLIIATEWVYAGWHGGLVIQQAKITTNLKFVETNNPSHVLLELRFDKFARVANSKDLVMEYGRIASAYEALGKTVGKNVKK